MSLETDGGSTAVSEAVATEATPAVSAPVVTEQKGEYTATDPGYEIILEAEPETNELAKLIEENKKPKPSETSDDASETDGDTEEAAETPTDDEAAVSQEPSDELLDRALELGYTLAELKSFKDVQSLETEVARVEKVHKRLLERQAATQPVVQEVTTPVEENPEPKWDELIEQGHDPDIVALQKTVGHWMPGCGWS